MGILTIITDEFHRKVQLVKIIVLFQVVKLPKGEDFNDWLAVHVVDFFNRINLIYGTVSCTVEQ